MVIFVKIVTPNFGFLFPLALNIATLLVRKGLLSIAKVGAGPFVRQILSRFSRRMKYEIADLQFISKVKMFDVQYADCNE